MQSTITISKTSTYILVACRHTNTIIMVGVLCYVVLSALNELRPPCKTIMIVHIKHFNPTHFDNNCGLQRTVYI